MLTVITASLDPGKTLRYWSSWRREAKRSFRLILVVGSEKPEEMILPDEVIAELYLGDEVVFRPIDGTVPAFLVGLQVAADGVEDGDSIVACLHDDLEIMQESWDEEVQRVFAEYPETVLAGFGGGTGLGSEDIYTAEYSPHQLARQDFVSNMLHAEQHGRRSGKAERLACTDGFSIIGKVGFLLEAFTHVHNWGCVHHAYDSWIGGLARKAGKEARLVPVVVHHAGGMTAVGSEKYQKWSREVRKNGDQDFWTEAHKMMYEDLKGVLPFNVREEAK